MSKFKVGDRVTVKQYRDNKYITGKSATIIDYVYTVNGDEVLLYFDEPHISLHSGLRDDDKYKNRCWWVENSDKYLKNEEMDVITIKRSGNTLIAFDNVNHKKAIAKCSTEDKFDLETGVKLAVDRLFEKEKPQYYTGKVVCGSYHFTNYFTKGKIYHIKNGLLCSDKSEFRFTKLESFDDLCRKSVYKWIEVVE